MLTLVLALIVALALHRVGFVLAHRLGAGVAMTRAVLRRTYAPARVALLLLALQLILAPEARNLHWLAVLSHLLGLGLIATLTWLAIRAVEAIEDTIVQRYPVSIKDNLRARRVQTQTQVLSRMTMGIIGMIGLAVMLMTFPKVREFGTSLLASAGLAGLVIGFAARPVLSNMIAGLQLALTQPIRLDDVVIIENEWGRIEEITGTYVIVRIWDERRLVVPLQYFIEHPFQNWTRTNARMLGTVTLHTDYRIELAPLRAELERICKESPLWDKRVCLLQVTDATETTVQLRALVSAADSGEAWDLRCLVREKLIEYIRQHCPQYLPRLRVEQRLPDATAPAAVESSRDRVSGRDAPASQPTGNAASGAGTA